MEITWYGQALFKVKGKNTTVIFDPFDPSVVGLKFPKDLTGDVVCVSHQHSDHNYLEGLSTVPVTLSGPGEFEVKGASIIGVAAFHDDKKGGERGTNTIFNVEIDGINVVHVGDLGHQLDSDTVEAIGSVDILLIPVGSVYTIDAKQASEVVATLEPRIIIPMHYKLEGLKPDLEPVENFLKEMGAENVAPIAKFVVTKDKLPDEAEVVVLTKS